MQRDHVIFELIEDEKARQIHGIELIASENFVSEQVMEAAGSILTNKYAEGYPGRRYYGGCEVVDEIEQLAIDRAKALFGAEYANVQPHSGSQANTAVYAACLKPGDKILGFDLSHGGHLTHGSPVNFSGKLYNPVFYGVDKETGRLNYDKILEIAEKEKPQLIIAGASSYSRDIDFKKFREIADKVGAILFADISHPAGLIAKGLLNDPIPHCHIVTTTTHKTLRGPRGGAILCKKEYAQAIDKAIFPGIQGGPLEHVIAAKAVSFKEAMEPEFKDYQVQVVKNCKKLAEELLKRDYKLVTGGTDNHLILLSLIGKDITGKDAETMLDEAFITVNKNAIPFDPQNFLLTSGIRIGTAAVTTRGMKEEDMIKIAQAIDLVLAHKDIEGAKKIATELTTKYPIY